MLYNKPHNCFKCDKPPKLQSMYVYFGKTKYYFYECKNCDIRTFSTKEEKSCRELWNAAIFQNKRNKGKKVINDN